MGQVANINFFPTLSQHITDRTLCYLQYFSNIILSISGPTAFLILCVATLFYSFVTNAVNLTSKTK